MKLSRNLALSCEILAAHKLRTLLSVTGIVVGVGTVVLIVSAGRGAEKQILDRIRDMGTNLIVVNAGQTRIVAGRQRQTATVTTLEDRRRRSHCSAVPVGSTRRPGDEQETGYPLGIGECQYQRRRHDPGGFPHP